MFIFFWQLYRRYADRTHLVFLTAVVMLAAWHVRGYDKGCLPVHDCHAYIKMVSSLAPDAAILPHHAMRILPSWVVAQLHHLGMGIHSAFLTVSFLAYWLTGILSYKSLRSFSANPWICLAGSLFLLVPHWAILIPLKTPYQASDAFVYLFTILTIIFVRQKNINALGIVSILSILDRQNCFVLGFLSLSYLLWDSFQGRSRWAQWRWFFQAGNISAVFYLVLIVGEYFLLSQYYGASESLIRHIRPSGHLLNLDSLAFFVKDSGFLYLIAPLCPWVVPFFRNFWRTCRHHWHLSLYGLIVVAQPFIAYEFTGPDNFVRIALQGMWVFYLMGIWSVLQAQMTPKWVITYLLYSLALVGIWSEPLRLCLMLAVTMTVWNYKLS